MEGLPKQLVTLNKAMRDRQVDEWNNRADQEKKCFVGKLGEVEWRNLKEAPLKSYGFLLLFINFLLPFTAKHVVFCEIDLYIFMITKFYFEFAPQNLFLILGHAKWRKKTPRTHKLAVFWACKISANLNIPPRNARTLPAWTQILHHLGWYILSCTNKTCSKTAINHHLVVHHFNHERQYWGRLLYTKSWSHAPQVTSRHPTITAM